VALALAASHPDRVSAVVAYAPLLRIHGAMRAQYVNLVGPLHLRETGYDPSLKFSVSFEHWICQRGLNVISPRASRSFPHRQSSHHPLLTSYFRDGLQFSDWTYATVSGLLAQCVASRSVHTQ
jgi:hypothetical protein